MIALLFALFAFISSSGRVSSAPGLVTCLLPSP
jgi:hypothetical protein